MPRWVLIVGAAVAVLAIASQPVIPGLAASAIEDRLTDGGGEAEVSISAVPAARLLLDDGDRLGIRASGLALELDEEADVFDRLDGFGEVEVEIADFTAGPMAIESFRLDRDAPGPYRMTSSGEASPADLVAVGAESLGLPGGGLAGLAFDDEPVPIELDVELISEDGEYEVVSGGGTVAGIPTGPLAGLITEAIVARL